MSYLKKKNSLENTVIKKLKLTEHGNIDKILQPIRNTINNHWIFSQTVFFNKKDEKFNNNSNNNSMKFLNQKTYFNIKNSNEDPILSKKIFNSTAKTNLTTQANSITIPSFFPNKASKPSDRSVSSFRKNKNKRFSIVEKKVLMQKLFQTYENEQYISNDCEKNIVFYNANNLRDLKIIFDSPTPKKQKKIEQFKKPLIQLNSLKIPKKNFFSEKEVKSHKSTRTPTSIFKLKHNFINFSISEKEENALFSKKKLSIKKKLTDKELIKNKKESSINSNRKSKNDTVFSSKIQQPSSNRYSANISPSRFGEGESTSSAENLLFGRRKSFFDEIKEKGYTSKEFKPKDNIVYHLKDFDSFRKNSVSNKKLSEKLNIKGIVKQDYPEINFKSG